MAYEEVMGQTADLIDLQRILLRQRPPLSNQAQQTATRWAVWAAAMVVRRYKAEYEALQVRRHSFWGQGVRGLNPRP